MKQTAIQEFIKWGDKMMRDYPMKELGFGQAIDKAVELLEMEKEQISESWNDGNLLGRNGHIVVEYYNGEGYYNKTYKK